MRFTRSISSLFTSFLLVLPTGLVCARSINGDRLLIIDEGELRNTYKAYIGDLEQRGFQLTYLSPKSPELDLFSYGERNWDHLLLLPPKSKAYGPKLTSQLLVEFLNKGGNILVLQDPTNTPEQLRDLARELEIGLAPKGDVVVDHFNWLPGVEGNDRSHNVILAKKPVTGPFTKNYFGGNNDQEEYVTFRGTGHTLGNSPLVQPILQASRTAYVYDPREETIKSENPWTAGQQLYLASGFQARNNARIAFVGSAESFNDEFQSLDGLRKGPNGHKVTISNRGFANDVTAWAFREIGVVEVRSVAHYPTKDAGKLSERNASESPSIYRIKTDVVGTI